MEEIQQEIAGVRLLLESLQERVKILQEKGVVLNFTVSSEKKTVEVSSASIFEISCKATINQEL